MSTDAKTSNIMNPFLGLNNGMFSVNMAVILLGASKILATSNEVNIKPTPEILFLIFFILLRIKIYVNDSFFIINKENDIRPFPAYGRLTSIIAWILFAFCAYSLPEGLSYWFFIFSFIFPSTWIILCLCFAKAKELHRELWTWLLSNFFYIGLTYILTNDLPEQTKYLIMTLLLLVLILDIIFGKAWKHLGS